MTSEAAATSNESITSSLEESITSTIASINSTLLLLNQQQLDNATSLLGDYSIFLSREVLARPPFQYVYGLVECLSRALPSLQCWKRLLFDDLCIPRNRKEKLSFLTKLLAVVSQTTRCRYDIYITPSNILCGRDVLSTHRFIRALVGSITVKSDDMVKAVSNVMEGDDSTLYKRAVRTRVAIKRFQAIVRGWSVRRQYTSQMKCDLSIEMTESVQDVMMKSIDEEESDIDENDDRSEVEAHRKAQSMAVDLLDSYNDMLSRKSRIESELKVTQDRLEVEKGKLARVLHIGSKHKKQSREHSNVVSLPPICPPRSAPNIDFDRDARKWSTNQTMRQLPRVDEAFAERITNLSISEREAKKKTRRIEEREHLLKQKMMASKEKESELKLQEQRISDLADKIRRQQLALKEQKMQFEQSKLTAPPSPPESSTSRPCSLCTEKEMQLRQVKDEVKHRMRLLTQREAEVIGRAQDLRRREIALLRLRDEIASASQCSVSTSEQLPNRSKPLRPVTLDENCKQATTETSIRKETNTTKRTRQKSVKRRRRHNDDQQDTNLIEKHKQQPQHGTNASVKHAMPIPANAEVNSIRSSFGEDVPTILEEPHQPDNDDSSVETFDEVDDIIMPEANVVSTTSSIPKSAATITPDESAKENLPKKSGREAVMPIKVPSLNENMSRSNGTTIDIPFDKSKRKVPPSKAPSPAKQRHIFTFEKKIRLENGQRSNMGSRENASGQSSRDSKRDRWNEDGWVSSFDVQMKCAMSKLKELV